MNESSDGIAEEVERQLQLGLAAAAIAARRATAARQHQVEQAQRDSAQNARAVKAQIDAERRLAAAHVQPVFEPGWWETATPGDVADMWQQANSWRDPDRDPATPTVFDHAFTRISHEVSDRAGLDATQILALATIQELEHEHQTTSSDPAHQPVQTEAAERDMSASGGFDDPQRREQLRTRLGAAGVPETAIEARTLADVGQGREPAEAAQTAVGTPAVPRRAGGRNANEQLQRRR
jgi:hypothetical protein